MKTFRLILSVVAFAMVACSAPSEPRLNSSAEILPRPTKMVHHDGVFTINSNTTLCYDESVVKVADILCEYVPFAKRSQECKGENAVRLLLDNSLGKEAYTLAIDQSGVTIKGGGYGGVLYGMESLLQLLPYDVFTKCAKLPLAAQYVEIEDSPRFPFRGMMMDMSSDYYTIEELHELLDIFAHHKINVCHVHLVDNGAFRLEIKSHPELALEGGFCGGDAKIRPHNCHYSYKWGGFYTQDEMRELIAYAADRNIEIIPELDVPGHSHAIARVRPDILCNFATDLDKSNGYDNRNVWCIAKESNYELLDDIIREMAEIFPSKYIHIGGDEVNFKQWMQCPDCQALAKRRGVKMGPEYQDIFMERVRQIVKKYNKVPAVWDEAIDGGKLSKQTIVFAWRNIKWTYETTKKGYPTIVIPGESFYFDTRQSDSEVGHNWSFPFDAKHIVDWNFETLGFTEEQIANIIGVEAAYWGSGRLNWEHYFTEGYPTDEMTYYNYMSYPRFSAYAEIGWCHNKRNWEEFSAFMNNSFGRTLTALGLEHRLETPSVKVEGGKLIALVDDGSTLYYEDIRTGKSYKYRKPLSAEDAKYTLFYSRRDMGISKKVGAEAYYAELKPKYDITASFNLKYSTSHPARKHHKWMSDRGAKLGDWVLYTFEEPLDCYSIELRTGYSHTTNWYVHEGYVEVSYDGVNFEKAEDLWYGYAVLHPKKGVRALRLVVTGNETRDYTVIQPLIVK